MSLIDSHCHLDFPEFADDLSGIVARARAAGVDKLITINTRVQKFPALLGLTERFDNVFCSVGTHPHNSGDPDEDGIKADTLVELSRHSKVVAIGEAGLDYFYDKSPRQAQARGLRTHIEAARLTGLPIVIHARDADDDMADLLEDEYAKGAFTGVLHCFSSGPELARRGLAIGLYLSFSGILTFKSAANVHEAARIAPMDRILVETDAPYLAPGKYRGKTNEPAYVVETAARLAEIRGISREELAMTTTANTHRLFSKLPATSSATSS